MNRSPVPLPRAPVASLAKRAAGAALLGLAVAASFGLGACSGAAGTPAPAAPAAPADPPPPPPKTRPNP